MPTITAAVSEATKERFDAIARARCTTPSRLAAHLVENFVNDERKIHTRPTNSGLQLAVAGDSPGEARTEQVFVRLAPRYYAELGRLATERNWYRSTYLANLFHAHADRKPVLCEYEIDALRQVGRQLADVGRNLN
jgi:predicted transcriptional regulator